MHFRLHANYFLLPWKIPEEISKRLMVLDSSVSKGSIYHIKQCPCNLLTWNWMFNGCIYFVRYLHILPFYFVRQNTRYTKCRQYNIKQYKRNFVQCMGSEVVAPCTVQNSYMYCFIIIIYHSATQLLSTVDNIIALHAKEATIFNASFNEIISF